LNNIWDLLREKKGLKGSKEQNKKATIGLFKPDTQQPKNNPL